MGSVLQEGQQSDVKLKGHEHDRANTPENVNMVVLGFNNQDLTVLGKVNNQHLPSFYNINTKR